MWFPTMSDTNRAVQSQKQARSLKFWIYKVEDCTIHVAKTKALISFSVTAKLICAFVFAYADCWFSHVAAHFLSCLFVSLKSHQHSWIVHILQVIDNQLIFVSSAGCGKSIHYNLFKIPFFTTSRA